MNRSTILLLRLLAAIVLLLVLLAPSADAHGDPEVKDECLALEERYPNKGRCVDFHRFNGVTDCEASPRNGITQNRRVIPNDVEVVASAINPSSGAAGPFQFTQRTWDWVMLYMGKPQHVGKNPASFRVAFQYKAARVLAFEIPGGGLQHWVCGYRFNDGTGPRFVTYELKAPRMRCIEQPSETQRLRALYRIAC